MFVGGKYLKFSLGFLLELEAVYNAVPPVLLSEIFVCVRGGRLIYVSGHNLDVVQEPRMVVTISSFQLVQQRRGRRMVPDHPECPENLQCFVQEVCAFLCVCVCVRVLGMCIFINAT